MRVSKALLLSLLAGPLSLVAVQAQAGFSTTSAAGLLVFPKLVVDSSNGIDTLLQISNVSGAPVSARCFYVNANGYCSNSGEVCNPNGVSSCGDGICVPGWQETDFSIRLTSKQPIAWLLGEGLAELPLANQPGPRGEFNDGSIPPAPDDPMIGELKCVQVGDDELPVDENSLIGVATIQGLGGPGNVDLASYNATGFRAREGANNRDNTLVLGEEYDACPNLLLIDQLFDGGWVDTNHLTLVPCSQDYNLQAPASVTAQYLVFNEFEQRFSTSKRVTCLTDLPMSDIDTRPGTADDNFSIFNFNVQGTLAGQTVIRGVVPGSPGNGGGLMAVVQEVMGGSSAAVEPRYRGIRAANDVITLPAVQPSGL